MTLSSTRFDVGWLRDPNDAASKLVLSLAATDGDPNELSFEEVQLAAANSNPSSEKLFTLIKPRQLFADLASYLAISRTRAISGDDDAAKEAALPWISFYLSDDFSWQRVGDLAALLLHLDPSLTTAEAIGESALYESGDAFRVKYHKLLRELPEETLVKLLDSATNSLRPDGEASLLAIVDELVRRGKRSDATGEKLISLAVKLKGVGVSDRINKLVGDNVKTFTEVSGLLKMESFFKIFSKERVVLNDPVEDSLGAKLIKAVGRVGALPNPVVSDGLFNILKNPGYDWHTRAMAAASLGELPHPNRDSREAAARALLKFVSSIKTRNHDDKSAPVIAKVHAIVAIGKLRLKRVDFGTKSRIRSASSVDIISALAYYLYHTVHAPLRLAAVMAIADIGKSTGLTAKERDIIRQTLADALGDPERHIRHAAALAYDSFIKDKNRVENSSARLPANAFSKKPFQSHTALPPQP